MRFDEETTPLQWGLAIALSLGAAAAITSLFGYPIGGATVGLAAVIVATLSLLRALARLVTSMNQQEVGLEFVSDDGRSARAWREEKKRSLRAIQELKLDYALQKIGDKDYQAILSQYEARALAAIHALDAKTALHPDLIRDLERYGAAAAGSQDSAHEQESAAGHGKSATHAEPSHGEHKAAEESESSRNREASSGKESAKGESTRREGAMPSSAGDPGQGESQEQDLSKKGAQPRLRVCSACSYEESDTTARFCKSCGQEFGA